MKLSLQQQKFSYDVMKLLFFIHSNNFKVTFGEVLRTKLQQEIYFKNGQSKTLQSQHLKKLAIDLNFFNEKNDLIFDKKELQFFGDYWESLDPLNRWGGNFKTFLDVPHFERKDENV